LRRPVITEKATYLQQENKYVFEVARGASKPQIRDAVEKAFKVKVAKVTVMTVSGKTKRMGRREITSPSWKKAIVSLEPGYKVSFFEGV
ncbi:50S ribosomal protein L23, partial [candidate division TA06 bacterium]